MKFWKIKEKLYPKEGVDYELVDVDLPLKVTSVKILKGTFKGIVYHYGKVEIEEGTQPKLKFDYYIDENGKFELSELHKNKKFDTLMGDILVSIFDKNILNKEIGEDESPRIFDTEESNLQ